METYIIRVNGVEYEVEVEKKSGSAASPAVTAATPPASAPAVAPAAATVTGAAGSIPVTSGTAGKVWKIVAKPGDSLEAGDQILILEAMKMEIPVVAPEKGSLASIDVAEGQEVKSGQVLATMK